MNRYAKPDGQGGYIFYTEGQEFRWPGGYNHAPSEKVLISQGYLPVVNTSYDVNTEKLGEYSDDDKEIKRELMLLTEEELITNKNAIRELMVVSPWQIRKALSHIYKRDAVEDAIRESSIEIKDAWEYATEFRRTNSLVVDLGLMLDISEEEIDAIFELAAIL